MLYLIVNLKKENPKRKKQSMNVISKPKKEKQPERENSIKESIYNLENENKLVNNVLVNLQVKKK